MIFFSYFLSNNQDESLPENQGTVSEPLPEKPYTVNPLPENPPIIINKFSK